MSKPRLRFAQDHATSRQTNEDSQHSPLSQNLTLLMADGAGLPVLRTPKKWPRDHIPAGPPAATNLHSSNSWAHKGEPPQHPLLGNKTVIEAEKP